MQELATSPLRVIAFYLPQFHPIPENDEWWGRGFTEWRNVATARQAFRWQHQPQIPADLGFYDLRLPETRAEQAAMAAAYGIHGFCYYHYWFHGRRLLERPFEEVLRSGEPSLPFLLCWANENWTRVWNGGDRSVVLEQTYSAQDDLDHIRHLAEAFSDHRHVRIDGKPVFLVYRPSNLPEPHRTTDTWRGEADRLGLGELYLCGVASYGEERDPRVDGFDAVVEFQPHRGRLGSRLGASGLPARLLRRVLRPNSLYRINKVFDYREMVRLSLQRPTPDYVRYRCVTPGWDNSARRKDGGARILRGSTPELYGEWLRGVARQFSPPTAHENLLFVNGWNEWAEGNHLEPDLKWGRAYLEQHLRS